MNSVKDALKLSLVLHIILSSVYMSAGNYASAEQNEAVYISSSGSVLEASISQVIDGEDGFWAASSGGTGGIEISIGVSTGTYYSAPSSLSYQVVSGTKSWVNIQHTWASAQNWGGYDDLAFYWYGRASGASLTVTVEASSSTNKYSSSFVDDFSGWRKVVLPLGGFTSVGSPSWSSVKKILIGYSGSLQESWFIDETMLEQAATLPPENDETLNILRYESFSTCGDNSDNGAYISSITDLYMCWNWDKAVLNDMDPNKNVLHYRNVHAMTEDSADFQTALDNGWVLFDSIGEYVYEQGWPQNKIMDVGSQSYREYIANWLLTQMSLGFDGVFGDNSLEIYPQTLWRLSTVPINPRTGQLYTDEDWMADRIGFINYLKSVAPNAVFLSNGMIYNGEEFYRDKALYEVFLRDAEIDGLFIEGIFNNDQGTPYSEAGWIKSVNLITWLQDNFLNDPAKFIVCRSLTMRGLPDGVTEDDFTAFIFASTLMGASRDGQNYVCAKGNMESAFTQSLYRIPLGVPVESYHIVDGTHVYMRRYSKTTILVNPTANPYTVNLDKVHLDLDGSLVSQVSLSAYEAKILSFAPG